MCDYECRWNLEAADQQRLPISQSLVIPFLDYCSQLWSDKSTQSQPKSVQEITLENVSENLFLGSTQALRGNMGDHLKVPSQ